MTNQTKYKFRIIQEDISGKFFAQLANIDSDIWSSMTHPLDCPELAEQQIIEFKESLKPRTFQVVKEVL